jgi:hypothetical protein
VPTATSLGAVARLFDHVTVEVGVVTANIGSIQQFLSVWVLYFDWLSGTLTTLKSKSSC